MLASETFRQGHLVLNGLAFDQSVEHLPHRGVLIELVLASLQASLPLQMHEIENAGHEDAPVGDDAIALQTLGDGRRSFASGHNQNSRHRERSRPVDFHAHQIEDPRGHADQDENKVEEAVQNPQKRMGILLRLIPLRRLWRMQRLQRLRWTPRRQIGRRCTRGSMPGHRGGVASPRCGGSVFSRRHGSMSWPISERCGQRRPLCVEIWRKRGSPDKQKRRDQAAYRRMTSEALVPPKPNELDSTVSMVRRRAL